MTFGAPHWFWALLVLPILALLFLHAEKRGVERLRAFASPRLLPQLMGAVNPFRRGLKFYLLLAGLALAVVSLAQPRWGYSFEDAKRKGIDLLIAIDTSRSMLSNDVQPNRLERVKLTAQDLINQLQGDRVGLIAFAGRAFVQAPLTIDYGAVVEAINDLDTKTIPEGGTNISEAIKLADQTYSKSAMGNRALVIFTDGEELSGDAIKTAKTAAEGGAKIFTIGVGTPLGSLIPITSEENDTAFVKDSKGQVVKSKLDENRLREIAQTAGGFYLHLENGPRTMQQLFADGIGKMQAADIDVRLSRRAIERYEWPLGGAVLAIAASLLIGDRKRERRIAAPAVRATPLAVRATALLLLCAPSAFAAAPGLDAYRDGKFDEAYQEFQQTLKDHPQTGAIDKLQFDSGTAAYKMKEYGKALESFSQALLSPDTGLQSKSHYNLGNTLYQRGETQKADEKKLTDWTNSLQHYQETLKLQPENKEAKENYEFVKKKIEDLKKKKEQPPPSPTPSPTPQSKDQKKDQQKQQDKNGQQDQKEQQESKDQQKQDQSQSQSQDGKGENQKNDKEKDQSQAKNEPNKDQPKAGESPSPTPGDKPQSSPSPSPTDGDKKGDQQKGQGQEPSPTPGEGDKASPSPSPSPGEDESTGEGGSPSPTPDGSPKKKLAGEIKGAEGDKSEKEAEPAEAVEAEAEKEGEMSERQARALLESMKNEEARVQLDERKVPRRVYNDW